MTAKAKPKKTLLRGIDPEALSRAADAIKLLGHPERLKIVECLDAGEATVTDIQNSLELPQAIVSQHLAKESVRPSGMACTFTTELWSQRCATSWNASESAMFNRWPTSAGAGRRLF